MHESSLLRDAVIYLAATIVCVPLAKRLGLGSVLGYLVAGCAIGPFGLSLVGDVDSIMHFSEFGVVLMLFVIGLELDPRRLWKMRGDVFLGGGLQMASCGLVLLGLGMAAGLPWRAALVTGLALALSSTAIAVQSMNERNLTPTPLGRISFAILLFQDVAAIPIIALVPLLAARESGAADGGLLPAVRVFASIAAVVVTGRYLLGPMLRIVARTELREVFTAFSLLVVAGVAFLMSLADLSMGLGAFLAGVLLASSEYRHAIETDIEPFKGLLLGLFFIAVGMSIDFALFGESPLLIAGLLAGLLVLKAATLGAISGRLGIAARQRWLFAALLAQGGEFAFVLLGVARTAHVLPGSWDARLTLVVALSMAMTPLLLVLHDRLEARRAADTTREYDQIEAEDAEVLMAGFGRYGQIVGRLLLASGVRATVLDHDPDQVELLRKFGFRVYYGDATRVDMLEAAGAGRARILINAIDDVDDSLQLVDMVNEHFPKLKIVARARNVTHFFELRRRGVESIERETFSAALVSGRAALEALGVGRYEAKERADRFRRHNLASLEQMMSEQEDEKSRFSSVRAARDELEEQFRKDIAAIEQRGAGGWQEDLDQATEQRLAPSS